MPYRNSGIRRGKDWCRRYSTFAAALCLLALALGCPGMEEEIGEEFQTGGSSTLTLILHLHRSNLGDGGANGSYVGADAGRNIDNEARIELRSSPPEFRWIHLEETSVIDFESIDSVISGTMIRSAGDQTIHLLADHDVPYDVVFHVLSVVTRAAGHSNRQLRIDFRASYVDVAY